MAAGSFLLDISHLRELLECEYRTLLTTLSTADGSSLIETPVHVPLVMHAAKMQVSLQLECEAAEAARVTCELLGRSFV
ncbi:Hypothetical protein, putative [Bodo saltans]|uniref:Uncharacterized protein n=1 Tax=Bodo saltans TaxID=75058 RepID=A0A0S4J0H0_BODSA|nr:Hypothetical protein, putative [Bodo saltans]|eukprot:CUG75027.1 Hypothetical protein, putative [Bodo saltans]